MCLFQLMSEINLSKQMTEIRYTQIGGIRREVNLSAVGPATSYGSHRCGPTRLYPLSTYEPGRWCQ
jgi:hypothetical protein